jgi:hypothetical protein
MLFSYSELSVAFRAQLNYNNLMNTSSPHKARIKDDQQIDLLAVRVALLKRRHTIASWAREMGVLKGTLHNALTGIRTGPKSRRIVKTLRRELGL